MYRILVTARSFAKTPGAHHELLLAHDCQVDLRAPDHPLDSAGLAVLLPGYDGVILGLDRCDAAALESADRLRVISRYGVGTEAVDLHAAATRGIAVAITPNTNNISVAELAIGLMFALARGIPTMAQAAREGTFARYTGVELAGRMLGVVGFGAIGREVAKRGLGLGMRVLAYDPFYAADWLGAESAPLDRVLRESHVISLHVPLTDETRNLINAHSLSTLRDGAFVINTARGGLVDETALYEALHMGRLGGAAMDVFAHEPPVGSPLLTLPNFIATPHAGGATREGVARMALMAAENCIAVLKGESCANLVHI
jgi:D-3-phosphoglycerate dehydrogenase